MRARRAILGICGAIGLLASLAFGAEGDIFWLNGGNYNQGPGMVRSGDDIYLVMHNGNCCYSPPAGWEHPLLVRYGSKGSFINFNFLPGPEDTHENGFGSMVKYGDDWLYAGIRTQVSTIGQENRIRLVLALTHDPMDPIWEYQWWDVRSDTMMPTLVWIGSKLYLFTNGNGGLSKWLVAIHSTGIYKAPALMFIGSVPSLPWSDIALADDGKLYMLVSGNGVCWWTNCFDVTEYSSSDEGLTWAQTQRRWSVGGLPGGIIPCVGDAGYLRDEYGHISRGALAVVSVVYPTCSGNPMDGNWWLHWWADPSVRLPISWLHEPGWLAPQARRHLTRR